MLSTWHDIQYYWGSVLQLWRFTKRCKVRKLNQIQKRCKLSHQKNVWLSSFSITTLADFNNFMSHKPTTSFSQPCALLFSVPSSRCVCATCSDSVFGCVVSLCSVFSNMLSNWWRCSLNFLVFCLFACVFWSCSVLISQGHRREQHFR